MVIFDFHHLQKGLTLYFYQWGFSYIMWHSRPRIYIPWEISSLLFWIYFVRGIIIMVLVENFWRPIHPWYKNSSYEDFIFHFQIRILLLEIINYLNKKEFPRPFYDLHIQPPFFRDRKIGYERQKIKLTSRDHWKWITLSMCLWTRTMYNLSNMTGSTQGTWTLYLFRSTFVHLRYSMGSMLLIISFIIFSHIFACVV